MYINLPEKRKRGERNTDNLYSLSGWVVECLMWAESVAGTHTRSALAMTPSLLRTVFSRRRMLGM